MPDSIENFIGPKYPKINGLYKRDPKTKKFIIGDYSLPEFESLSNTKWLFTEKIDGTNIRVSIDTLFRSIEFSGRTNNAQVPPHLIVKLLNLFNNAATMDKLSEYFLDTKLTIYGEGYGYKIQSGGKYFCGEKKVGFIVFDIRIGDYWLPKEKVYEVCNALGLEMVPYKGTGTIEEAVELVSAGLQSDFGTFICEGLVLTTECDLKTRSGKRIMVKIKTVDHMEET